MDQDRRVSVQESEGLSVCLGDLFGKMKGKSLAESRCKAVISTSVLWHAGVHGWISGVPWEFFGKSFVG